MWMRSLVLVALLAGCAPAAAAPVPTEDPRVAALTAERDALTAEATYLGARLDAALVPTFVMWNVSQTIRRGGNLMAGLPDTFTARIQFTATGPVRAMIMTFPQFVQYTNGRPFEALTYPAATSLDVTFHDAEGCAGYLLVLDAEQEATVTPIVTITRAPSPIGTGACAE